MTAPVSASIADRLAAGDVLVAMADRADRRDWSALAECFAAHVEVDYTALLGGEPAVLGSDQLIGGWADTLTTFDATQHIVANLIVRFEDEQTARVRACFQATHVKSGLEPAWVLGGSYDVVLENGPAGWRITALTMTPAWSTGERPS